MKSEEKKNTALWFIPLLWAAGFIAFIPLLKNRFIGDDYTALSIHRVFKSESFFQTILYGGNDFFRPLNMALVMGRGAVFGDNPLPFVIANILLHLVNSTMVFFLARKLFTKRIAVFSSAVFFLLAFSHYEGITWISSSITLLVTFLVMLSLYSHIQYRLSDKKVWFFLSIVAFVFAFLTKETAIGLPFLIVLYDLFFAPRKISRRFKFFVPYLVFGLLLACYVVIQTQWAMKFAGGEDSVYKPGWHAVTNVLDYWVWLWMPNPRHPYVAEVLKVLPKPFLIVYWILAGLVAASLAAVIVLAILKKLSKTMFFCFLATFVSLAVFLPFSIKISARYAYLPSCFFALFAGGAFAGIHTYLKEHGKSILKIILWSGAGLYLAANVFALILVQREFVKVSTLTEELAHQVGSPVNLEPDDVVFIEGLPSHVHLREAIQWFYEPGVHVHADNDKYSGTPRTLQEVRSLYDDAELYYFRFDADSLSQVSRERL
ncbi:hypothetical protein GF359_05540 [candidate division WOR-3 bacterium]|uniref:Glycosyltransferase RgtA/B/C/D-like domain-containing protein n=1 Tax=candidate division WOR-3 bacterium TaxID=2052148 RepID=A0A9D5K9K4_UNCW3|nr:hypothetical protein [candidate division WOR-3 bacterium]MBD3364659.1 hypothetical protein [candidate division WOR-3 bacterium]